MAVIKSFYEVLNIGENASLIEIKTNYHKLARLYHPDITKLKNTHDKFIEINEAYRTLKDPILRKAYDFGLRQKRDKLLNQSKFKANENSSVQNEETIDIDKAKKDYIDKTNQDLLRLEKLKQLAKTNYSNGNFSDALINCDEIIKIDNQIYEIWKIKGDIFYQIQEYDLSMEAYSKACKIDDNPEIKSLLTQVINIRVKNMNKKKETKKKGIFGIF